MFVKESDRGMKNNMVWEDVALAWASRPVWLMMGWLDLRQRYRRSVIGQFWLTISMLIAVLALGFLYGHLFKVDTHEFIPFLGIGFVFWGLISTSLNEGCSTFINSAPMMRQVKLPLFFHVFRQLWRNSVIFAHNAIIIVGLMVYYAIIPTPNLLWMAVGMGLLLLNLAWISLLLGMLSARFRDVPLVVQNLVQVSFFVTPINWKPEMLGEMAYLNNYNPFFHALEVVRAPLLGHAPLLSIIVMCVFLLVGTVVTSLFYRRFQSRVTYWL
jgi:ABC-type polysaccharide/polyol phosphate export permease